MKRRWFFLALLLAALCLGGCAGDAATQAGGAVTWASMTSEGTMELSYAEQFSVENYSGGYRMVTIGDSDTYLVVPEGAEAPTGIPEGVTVPRWRTWCRRG